MVLKGYGFLRRTLLWIGESPAIWDHTVTAERAPFSSSSSSSSLFNPVQSHRSVGPTRFICTEGWKETKELTLVDGYAEIVLKSLKSFNLKICRAEQ